MVPPISLSRHSARGVIAVALCATVSWAGCSANDSQTSDPFANVGSGAANTGSGGSAASSTGGGSTGGADQGQGGTLIVPPDAGSGIDDASLTDGPGAVNDATIDVTDDACSDEPYMAGPLVRTCATNTANECDGSVDVNSAFPNGAFGNGFDDDCDGEVDEGCQCNPGVNAGETRECWLISGSQANSGGQAVGWCASNSRGTQSCTIVGSGESAQRIWDGQCRGAQPPFPDDVCASGDFDCDGLDVNSQTQDCSCNDVLVECPTDPIVTQPYPDPNSLLEINGEDWLVGNGTATNWGWKVVGGDCDNILPHPSFALYANQGAPGQTPVGNKRSDLGPNSNQTGYAFLAGSGAGAGQLYPAFALSGDYLVTGSFTVNGEQHECTVKVQVRAPGIRAEACWTPMPNDLDLHFARLQGASCSTHGWFSTCASGEEGEDCYFSTSTGCRGFDNNPSEWGYARSAASTCQGWASRRGNADCDNPRLDSDNITCNTGVTNPAQINGFCGAENINLDNPNNGDRFAVGLHGYSVGNAAMAHVNIYCNGERRLSLGHDPISGQNFPVIRNGGASSGGDFWEVATVEAVVDGSGELTDCVITPVNSISPKGNKDGSTAMCVDTDPRNGQTTGSSEWHFTSGGGIPANADDLCWH